MAQQPRKHQKNIIWENYLVKAEPIGNCGTNKPDILPDDLPIFNPNPRDNISLVTLKLVRKVIGGRD